MKTTKPKWPRVGYKDDGIWADEFKEMFDTEESRRYSGRRMFRLINMWPIRKAIQKAKHS